MIRSIETCHLCNLPIVEMPWVIVMGSHTLAAQPGLSKSTQQFIAMPRFQGGTEEEMKRYAKGLQIRGAACYVAEAKEVTRCLCPGS